MGRVLFSLAFATALLGVASSEASAASSFVCQAVGPRSVGYGRAYFVADAKLQAPYPVRGAQRNLHHQLLRSGVLITGSSRARSAAARSCLRASRTTREVRWRRFVPSGLLRQADFCTARRRSAQIKRRRKNFCARNFAPEILRPSSRAAVIEMHARGVRGLGACGEKDGERLRRPSRIGRSNCLLSAGCDPRASVVRSQNHHKRARLHPAVEIDHILIGQPDATRRNRMSDPPGLVRAVDAIQRVLAA